MYLALLCLIPSRHLNTRYGPETAFKLEILKTHVVFPRVLWKQTLGLESQVGWASWATAILDAYEACSSVPQHCIDMCHCNDFSSQKRAPNSEQPRCNPVCSLRFSHGAYHNPHHGHLHTRADQNHLLVGLYSKPHCRFYG